VYSNPRALIPLAKRAVRPDWVWVASWIGHHTDHGLDPHHATSMPNGLWSTAGQRAWQYAGSFGGSACTVRGLPVDINVADSAVLVSTAHSDGTYAVQDGDSLSLIAARFHVPGGWPALYQLNKAVVGNDPGQIHKGQVLKLP
jgi:nucleoid-associated protein YgaU